ncbi:MAG: hypothetical protein O7C66_08375, partial [Alphaproteobacteria bacterium]|nr:hypothetical protein [Alphaproteobacteria bacterium]
GRGPGTARALGTYPPRRLGHFPLTLSIQVIGASEVPVGIVEDDDFTARARNVLDHTLAQRVMGVRGSVTPPSLASTLRPASLMVSLMAPSK